MASLISKKILASTIIEVLVSLIVIMLVFTLAIGIFSRLVTSGFSLREKDVTLQMEKMLNDAREGHDFSNKSLRLDGVEYKKKVYSYNDYKDLYVIEVRAEQHGKSLAELKQVIKGNPNEIHE